MSDTTNDLTGEIHTMLTRYNSMSARHTTTLDAYRDAAGDVREGEQGAYDEKRTDNAIEASDLLDCLAARLRELVGPPVPGDTFTLTFAGPERHDGEKPYSFVVNAADLDDAHRTLLTLPCFKDWLREQLPSDTDGSDAPDVLFVADQSHPGIPKWGGYNDLRREQATLTSSEPARPGDNPAVPALPAPGSPPPPAG